MVVAGEESRLEGNGVIFIVGKFFSLEVGPPKPGRGWVVSATGSGLPT
jgi:hypothetical protein